MVQWFVIDNVWSMSHLEGFYVEFETQSNKTYKKIIVILQW